MRAHDPWVNAPSLPADVFVASRPTTAPACVLRSKPVMRAGYDLGGSPNADVVQYRHSGGICPPEYKASAMSKAVVHGRGMAVVHVDSSVRMTFSTWNHIADYHVYSQPSIALGGSGSSAFSALGCPSGLSGFASLTQPPFLLSPQFCQHRAFRVCGALTALRNGAKLLPLPSPYCGELQPCCTLSALP